MASDWAIRMIEKQDRFFARIALERGILDAASLAECRRALAASAENRSLAAVAVELGYLSSDRCRRILASLPTEGREADSRDSVASTRRGPSARRRVVFYSGVAVACLLASVFAAVRVMSSRRPVDGSLVGGSDAAGHAERRGGPEESWSATRPVLEARSDSPARGLDGEAPRDLRVGRRPRTASLTVALVDLDGERLTGWPIAVARGGRAILEERTDRLGQITASRLPPGDYSLRIGDGSDSLITAKSVLLQADEEKELVVRVLPFDRSISGRVLDRSGRPVAGLVVRARKSEPHAVEGALVLANLENVRVETGPAGGYRISGLDHAEYEVFTEPTRDYPSASRVFLAGVESADLIVHVERALDVTGIVVSTHGDPIAGVSVVTRGAGARSDERGRYSVQTRLLEGTATHYVSAKHSLFRMEPVAFTYEDVRDLDAIEIDLVMDPVVGFATVRGVIRDAEGSPVAGERVFLSSERLRNGHGAVSGEDGRFTIADVEFADDYQAVVQPKEAYRDFSIPKLTVDDATPELEIVLEPFGAGSLAGEMVDPEGAPIAGFTLRMRHASAQRNVVGVTGDSSGRFWIDGVATGEWSFETISSPRLAIRGVHLEPLEEKQVRLVLDWGEHELSGTVVDPEGLVVPGLEVRLSWSHEAAGLKSASIRRTRSDAEGRFHFSALGGGDHTISVVAPRGYEAAPVTHAVGAGAPEPVVVLRPR